MIKYAKDDCICFFKNYQDLKIAEQGIYSSTEILIRELFKDEDGEQILKNICDAELYNRSFEDNRNNADPNNWENWMLNEIRVDNSQIFFDYENDMGTRFTERLENTDIVFLENVVKFIYIEIDNMN